MKNCTLLPLAFLLISHFNFAQNSRITEYNEVGWYNYFGTFKIAPRWSIHSEYQFRREQWVTNWQQSLLRVGLNYQLVPEVQLRAGYAWIETFPYGRFPINGFGRDFTEHRLYQMVTVTDKIRLVDLSHRFMLEQRWIGTYSFANAEREDRYIFLNRLRYMYRMQIPLRGQSIADKTPYCAAYNEIFVGFGRSVNENIFDQNRIGLLLGYRFNKTLRVEGGYLNQILQLGREISGRNVFQYNNGIIVNLYLNLDWSEPNP
jgi:hypothetical protein